ncbi:5-oxoprolinase subunit PxpB [Mannheimia bovis]|uniref:5-oxoprolinase subunit PxpB n=1 Tax=Mannheimia bovis TaxID=2770636 RepID=A0A7H1C4P5_9PAST|nr:5-oxoprolinase subunit PxpB [Mannheimia bovis]QNS15950.1 5-oxoprolinase subunit PxpB [Mannheimia bovis]
MLTIHHTSEHSLLCLAVPPAELSKQQQIWAVAEQARAQENVVEVVVGMNNFTIFHNLLANSNTLISTIQQLWQNYQAQVSQAPRLIEIPVHYGGEFGEDLFEVAKFHNTTAEEIIRRHTEPTYTVFMIGFQPGFPYLNGLPENLHTPRRDVPRTKVPAGSVGIGGSQTGIYPFTSPGGWQLLGRTELPLFNIQHNPPTLLSAGDNVRFVAESITL